MKKTLAMVLGTTLVFSGAGFGAGKVLFTPSAADASISVDDVHDLENKEAHSSSEELKPVVVDIGRIMVPIYRAKTIRYVVANMAISVDDASKVEFMETEEGKTKVRNYIITTMLTLAEKTSVMNKPNIDTDELSDLVHAGIKDEFKEINDILFLSLVQTETKRS